jgi:hypothetical protein
MKRDKRKRKRKKKRKLKEEKSYKFINEWIEIRRFLRNKRQLRGVVI